MLNSEISRVNSRHTKPAKDLKNKNENTIKTVGIQSSEQYIIFSSPLKHTLEIGFSLPEGLSVNVRNCQPQIVHRVI